MKICKLSATETRKSKVKEVTTLINSSEFGSMKNVIARSLALLFWTCMLAGWANAQSAKTVNLSSRKAVLEWLGKQKQGKFKQDDVCIGRLKESKQVIVIGFSSDYGCRLDGAFVNSVYIEAGAELSAIALNALGWKKAKQKQREQLAKLWVEKGLQAFSTVLYEKGDDFVPGRGITYRGGRKPIFPEFHPPQVSSKANGEVVVTLWTSVTINERRVHHHEYRFTKDGSLAEE